ncbi:M15 family metallopeptidase [Catenovulum maritimum]|uniref:D-alanyl-D-alanine carboxypeptidase-like core domain-containing protein n=1 Tax=Catenovulum maritimum TaxID=1513271 RepID=A0A0J8GUZ8_9ALTE|nr:M15 family metallopeptidase [Catenovulum maritimum]KMT65124.1 hypothetical protein XM47_10315 [Catenovulum maritimum]
MNANELTGLAETHLTELFTNHQVNTQVLDAVKQLQQQAKLAGFDCRLASSFRSYERQKTIWNKKATGELVCYDRQNKAIDLSKLSDIEKVKSICIYSAIPGSSRHHWGTDFDIYDFSAYKIGESPQLIESEYIQDGKNAKLANWLMQNAAKLGISFPYLKHSDQGVADEPWHISFTAVSTNASLNFNKEILQQALVSQPIALGETVLNNLDELYQEFIEPYQCLA